MNLVMELSVGSLLLKRNSTCKGNAHIKKVIKELNAIANKDLHLHFDLVDIAGDFGYNDNIEVIQTPDGVHIKTKRRNNRWLHNRIILRGSIL